MAIINKDKIKYKLLSFDELVINLDRLSRFKLPEESYNRVFNTILYKNLIYPKYSKKDLESLSSELISKYVQIIWNNSVSEIFGKCENNSEVNKALKMMAEIPFKNIDKNTKTLINTKLYLSPILNKLDENSVPLNIKFLVFVNKTFNSLNPLTRDKIDSFRYKYALKYPVKKLVIVEGITEENLLPVFAEKLHFDFDKDGIFILGAGGKSKSPSIYMNLRERLKIPVVLLFDSDAKEICEILKTNLLKKDKMIIIEKGEFEDILSLNLLKRALNNEYETKTPLVKDDLHIFNKMCENIEYYYRTRNLGEFKKSRLSKIIANNIKYDSDITPEIKKLIKELVSNNKET